MRFLVILLLAFCWSANGNAQKGSSDQIILKSVKTSTELKQLPLKENILMIRGKSVTAARGYQIVYSKKLKYAWVQSEGRPISTDEVTATRKGKGNKMSGVTVHCNGSDGCGSCQLVNIGSARNPIYSCSGDCDCFVLITPDKGVFAEFETPGGDWF